MKNVEDIYPLSPLQEGILFHCVAEPDSGVYVNQVSVEITGAFDPARFDAAWRKLVERHPVLRTAFLWDGLDEPLQVVREEVSIPWSEEDWRPYNKDQRDSRKAELLRERRSKGFDVAIAPLIHMTVVRTGEDTWWWLWTFHHLLIDGWSTAVLLREAFQLYATDKSSFDVIKDTTSYSDYVAWQKDQDLESAERFWREELRDFGAPTRIPWLRPENSAASKEFAQREAVVSAEVTKALRSFASDHALTLNTVLQGAWALLLWKLSRERDVIFGTTTSGRPTELAGIEDAVGLFINTLPLRVRVDPDQVLIRWLTNIQKKHLEIRRWEFSPLSSVQRWSDLAGGESLFDSILVFENYPDNGALVPKDGDIEVGRITFDEKSHYPLAILCLPQTELRIVGVHDPVQISGEPVALILDLLVRTLESIVRAPKEAALGEIDLTGEGDLEKLESSNDTSCKPPSEECIHHWFDKTSEVHSSRTAVTAPDGSLTYRELSARATTLAKTLRALGVSRNVPVAILAEPSADLIVGIMGILKAGGGYVPIDPSSPRDFISQVVEDAGAKVVVTRRGLGDLVPAGGVQIVTIEQNVDPQPDHIENLGSQPGDTAYILYTSGTSGRPKGVPVTHANLVHSTEAREHVYREDVGCFLLLSSFTFDSSVVGIFWTLVTGGTLLIPRQHLEQDLTALLGLMRKREVTHTLCLPALYELLLREARIGDLLSLQTVIVAGESCPASLVRMHHELIPDARLFNEYGPTEATVWSTAQELTPKDAIDPVSIGRPIPRMRAYVLDENKNPVPTGIPGELWLAGAGVTRGYLNLGAETSEKFTDLQVLGRKEHAYRTGDLAAWRPDGSLLFLGRIDSQLKLRGHRIEPAGIETLLREHEKISDAAVVLCGTPVRLVAYVVPSEEASPDTSALRDDLSRILPRFLVPDTIVLVPSLPRTRSGKIDRHALPDPAMAIARPVLTAPRNDIEKKLVRIWCDVLDLDAVGIHEDFFSLGGDSILSIQIVSRIRSEGLRLEPRHVLTRPTIAQLAEAVTPLQDAVPFPIAEAGDIPLSPSQSWFLGRGLAAPHHWNQSALFEVPSDLDVSRLGLALKCLATHHDQLRVFFEADSDGLFHQVLTPPDAIEIPIDVQTLPSLKGARREEFLQQRMLEAQKDIDLSKAPLIRGVLFRPENAEPGLLLLAIHHLLVDAVSWSILIEDLENAYAQTSRTQEPRLGNKTASFGAWTTLLLDEFRGAPSVKNVETWTSILSARANDLDLETSPSAPLTEAQARTVRRELDRDLTNTLLTKANEKHRTRAEELLLTALVLSVGRNGDTASLRLLREGHGRDGDLDVSRTVGWFTSMAPVALSLENPADAAETIQAAKRQIRATPISDHSYGLLRWPSKSLESSKLLEKAGDPLVLFNFLGRQPEPRDGAVFRQISDAKPSSRSPSNERSHLLEINISVREGRLIADWIYCDGAHRRETVERWALRFTTEVERLVDHCLIPQSVSFTASDFPDAELDDGDLTKLLARLGER